MTRTITKKYTVCGSEGKFLGVIRMKIGPASATKSPQRHIVRLSGEQALESGSLVDNTARETINQVDSSKKSFIPKVKGHRCLSKK